MSRLLQLPTRWNPPIHRLVSSTYHRERPPSSMSLGHNSDWVTHYRQRRTYVFFPSSYSEWVQAIRSVLMGEDPKGETSTIRVRFQRTREQMMEYYKLQRKKHRKKKKLEELYKEKKALYNQKYNEKKELVRERYKQKKEKMRQEAMYYTQTFRVIELQKEEWFSEKGYPLTSVDSHTGRFVNPWNNTPLTNGQIFTFTQFLSWQFQKLLLPKKQTIEPSIPPVITTTNDNIQYHHENDRVKVRWLGHSTCLLELHQGVHILTDPHLTDYAAHIPRSSGTQVIHSIKYDLPEKIPIVVLSHDHYDHLDIPTLQLLKDKLQYIVVPKGHSTYLQSQLGFLNGIQIIELEWWQSATFRNLNDDSGGLQFLSSQYNLQDLPIGPSLNDEDHHQIVVTCTPAQHYCSRTPFDRNKRLWCSYAIQSNYIFGNKKKMNFFFAGDTGYPKEFPLFRQIGDLLGPFDMAAIPIGAYQPNHLFESSHVNPQQAIQIHTDIQSKKSVAIHWGTFDLADEDLHEPPTLLHQLISTQNNSNGNNELFIDFSCIPHGHTILSNPTNNKSESLMAEHNYEEDDVVVDDDDDDYDEHYFSSSS